MTQERLSQSSYLPPLYSRWMDDVFSGRVPEETDATCGDCAMCGQDGKPGSSQDFFFNPETKCCTYIPTLPNFLVGRILDDEDAAFVEGRLTVEARLDEGVGVTPFGLAMPPAFSTLYAETAPQTFGRSACMRCPHYLAEQGGRCGVWKHRAAVCATWYCKHVRGAVGMRFWKTLLQLLSATEHCLSRWCVDELGIGVEALALLFPLKHAVKPECHAGAQAPDSQVDGRKYAAAWGKWKRREREFYREAAWLVNTLEWKDVIAIGGPELRIFEQLAREAYRKLVSEELPPSLKAGGTRVIETQRKSCRVSTYSPLDPLDVPQSVIAVLPYFDGRSTTESMANIEQQEGLRLSPGLVRKLVDFEILVHSPSPEDD
jgi:hypothetical protein